VVASGVHEGKAIPISVPSSSLAGTRSASSGGQPGDQQAALCGAGPRRQVFVRDFGSTNGTFVNDQLVEGEVELNDQTCSKSARWNSASRWRRRS